MEEKKKRLRPTVAQVNELKANNEKLFSENCTLRRTVEDMENTIARLRESNTILKKSIVKKTLEIERLKSRCLWDRLLNK